MCNAYNHPEGCECGFGPPYPDVDVTVKNIVEQRGVRGSKVADLDVTFYIPKANFFHRLDIVAKDRLLEETATALQCLADGRFGKANIQVLATDVRRGSITFAVVLVAMVGKFFKDYPTLKAGVLQFARDIKMVSGHLNRLLRRVYLREERRVLNSPNNHEQPKVEAGKAEGSAESNRVEG